MRRLLLVLALVSALGGTAAALMLPGSACAKGKCSNRFCTSSSACEGGCMCVREFWGDPTGYCARAPGPGK